MARKNPQSPLDEGVFYDNFSLGLLDPAKWTVLSGVAPGETADHIGYFAPDSVNLDEGMLDLRLNQITTTSNGNWNASTNSPALQSGVGVWGDYYTVNVAGSTSIDGTSSWSVGNKILFDGFVWRKVTFTPAVISLGGAIETVEEFGNGTLEIIVRFSSTAVTPTEIGEPKSGSISEALMFIDDGTDYVEMGSWVEGKSDGNLSNFIQMISSDAVGVSTTDKAFILNPEDSFQTLRFVKHRNEIEFFINDKLVETMTTNIPTETAKITLAHYGTNDISLGGLATPLTLRNMYVSHVKFTPEDTIRNFGGVISSQSIIRGSFTTDPAGVVFRNFGGTLTAVASVTGSFFIEGGVGQTRSFGGTVSAVGSITGAFTVENTGAGVYRDFSGVLSAIGTITGSFTRTGGGVAGTTGWKDPSVIVAPGWLNGDNMRTSDEGYATVFVAPYAESPEVYAYNWGLNIPTDSTINGIQVRMKAKVQAGSVSDSYFRVINQSTFLPKSVAEKQIVLGTSGGTSTSTGWLNPTLTSAAGSSGQPGWVDPNDVFAAEGDNAYYTSSVAGIESPTFRAYSFTGLTIPNGVGDNTVINGIRVRIKGHTTAAVEYAYIKLGNAAGTINSVADKPMNLPVTTPAYVTYGSETDLWGGKAGAGAWTAADFNSDFLVYLGFAGITQMNLDHIQIEVFYTTGSGSGSSSYVTIGGTTDVWSGVDETGDNVYDRQFTAAQLNDPNFCFWGAFIAGANGADIQIDNIQMNVSYTTPLILGGGTNPGDPPPAWDGDLIPLPSKIVATYFAGWSGENITDVPMSYNQIYLFHAVPQGTDGTFTCPYLSTFTPTRIETTRGRGQRDVLTCGGANAGFFFNSRPKTQKFVDSVANMYSATGGFDGIDYNMFEQFTQTYGSGANATLMGSELAWASGQFKTMFGSDFTVSMAPHPGGGYAPADRIIAAAVNTAGYLDYAAPQFYDSPDLNQPALIVSLINEWVTLLGSAAKVVVGLGANYPGGPTLTNASSAVRTILAAHPTIRGVMGWSAQDDRGAGWTFGSTMKGILGSTTPTPPPSAPPPAPPPAPAPAPGGGVLPSKILTSYWQGWSGGNINSLSSSYTQINLFHLTPSGNYSGDGTLTNTYTGIYSATAVQQFRANRRVAITIGGGNAGIYFANRTMTTKARDSIIAAINAMGGVDEVNYNFFEAFSSPGGLFPDLGGSPRSEWVTQATEMKWLADELKTTYSGLTISMAPAPGAGWAPFDRYAAVFMGASLDYAGIQLYDSPDFSTISNCVLFTNQWITLIGAAKVMMGFGANYSTTNAMSPQNCATAYSQIKAANPLIRGAFGWSAQTDAQAGYTFGSVMRAVL